MRNRGGIILVIGIAGFLYCSVRASDLPPRPPDQSIGEMLHSPRGRWEALRDVSVFLAAAGAVLALFSRGQ